MIIGAESECAGVLLTRLEKKPPRFRMEAADEHGTFSAYMHKVKPGPQERRGWTVLYPKGAFHTYPTRREACERFLATGRRRDTAGHLLKFISFLQSVLAKPTPSQTYS